MQPMAMVRDRCRVSETASAEVLALPMHGYLDEPTVTRVCDTLIGALANP